MGDKTRDLVHWPVGALRQLEALDLERILGADTQVRGCKNLFSDAGNYYWLERALLYKARQHQAQKIAAKIRSQGPLHLKMTKRERQSARTELPEQADTRGDRRAPDGRARHRPQEAKRPSSINVVNFSFFWMFKINFSNLESKGWI